MLVSGVIYLLVAAGILLVGLGVFGIVKEKFSQETTGSGPGVTFTAPLSAFIIILGIGSLALSGYLALNNSGRNSSTQPSVSPTAEPTTTPDQSNTRPADSASPHSGAVKLLHPTFGARVAGCAVFSGTSDLPPDQTLVLVARNLSDSTKTLYLEPVNDWNVANGLSKWTGFQYFGSGNSSAGQSYEVFVIEVKTETVREAEAKPANNPIWAVKSLPAGSQVKTAIHVVRKNGPGPSVCH